MEVHRLVKTIRAHLKSVWIIRKSSLFIRAQPTSRFLWVGPHAPRFALPLPLPAGSHLSAPPPRCLARPHPVAAHQAPRSPRPTRSTIHASPDSPTPPPPLHPAAPLKKGTAPTAGRNSPTPHHRVFLLRSDTAPTASPPASRLRPTAHRGRFPSRRRLTPLRLRSSLHVEPPPGWALPPFLLPGTFAAEQWCLRREPSHVASIDEPLPAAPPRGPRARWLRTRCAPHRPAWANRAASATGRTEGGCATSTVSREANGPLRVRQILNHFQLF
jgi:hypothetical protein